MRRVAAGLAALALLGGCGDDGSPGGGSGGDDQPQLTVSAAASLKRALTSYGERFTPARPRFSFAGSDELAAQIRQGVRPDVFVAANTRLPDALFAEGMVERPVTFAANRLVLAVPRGSDVRSVDDLTHAGLTLAIGAPGVPVGSYTRDVLARLGPAKNRAILGSVRSNEPDVAGVTGKLVQGAVDAGFLYITDVVATRGELRAIELPCRLRPRVEYGVAVVEGARRPQEARAFVAGLLEGTGREALREAGFEPPPGP